MSESEFARMLRLKREEREKKYTDTNDPGLSSNRFWFEKYELFDDNAFFSSRVGYESLGEAKTSSGGWKQPKEKAGRGGHCKKRKTCSIGAKHQVHWFCRSWRVTGTGTQKTIIKWESASWASVQVTTKKELKMGSFGSWKRKMG